MIVSTIPHISAWRAVSVHFLLFVSPSPPTHWKAEHAYQLQHAVFGARHIFLWKESYAYSSKVKKKRDRTGYLLELTTPYTDALIFIKMTGKIVGGVCWLHFWYSVILECAWKDEKCFFLMYLHLQFTVYIFYCQCLYEEWNFLVYLWNTLYWQRLSANNFSKLSYGWKLNRITQHCHVILQEKQQKRL